MGHPNITCDPLLGRNWGESSYWEGIKDEDSFKVTTLMRLCTALSLKGILRKDWSMNLLGKLARMNLGMGPPLGVDTTILECLTL